MLALLDLPLPIHGMSNINKSMLEALSLRDVKVEVVNSVPSYAAGLFPGIAWKILKVIHTLCLYFYITLRLLLGKHKEVYRPINGGSGQFFDLIYIFICRLFGVRLFIHHHSFSYYTSKSALFDTLQRLAGGNSVHIVLGSKMKEKLIELYKVPSSRIIVLSNLAFFDAVEWKGDFDTPERITIGHLANLSIDKGVDVFLDVCAELRNCKVPFSAKIAGPYSSEKEEKLVQEVTQKFSDIEYVGPVYGQQKDTFFKSLDCFVFPSKYINEAEPLVLYEAAAYGVCLIGTRRGCMEEVINNFGGVSFAESDLLAKNIENAIEKLIKVQACNVTSRSKRAQAFLHCRTNADNMLRQLMDEMGIK